MRLVSTDPRDVNILFDASAIRASLKVRSVGRSAPISSRSNPRSHAPLITSRRSSRHGTSVAAAMNYRSKQSCPTWTGEQSRRASVTRAAGTAHRRLFQHAGTGGAAQAPGGSGQWRSRSLEDRRRLRSACGGQWLHATSVKTMSMNGTRMATASVRIRRFHQGGRRPGRMV